jgi:hypothetical protein
MEDLSNFFKGEVWKLTDIRNSELNARATQAIVNIEESETQFNVKIQAIDDPLDSEEVTTSKPLKAIVDFLGEGLPGAEYYEQMASSPRAFASYLNLLAYRIDKQNIDKQTLTELLRRASIALNHKLLHRVVVAMTTKLARENVEQKEMGKLLSEMKKKGWKVEESEDDRGEPQLTVNISDIYEVVISIESILYDYIFQIPDHPDLTEDGITDDPIREFQNYVRKHNEVMSSIKSPEDTEIRA